MLTHNHLDDEKHTTFTQRTGVRVPRETKRRRSFPEANHVVSVRQDRTLGVRACVSVRDAEGYAALLDVTSWDEKAL